MLCVPAFQNSCGVNDHVSSPVPTVMSPPMRLAVGALHAERAQQQSVIERLRERDGERRARARRRRLDLPRRRDRAGARRAGRP